jgi:microcystin-dependent protein
MSHPFVGEIRMFGGNFAPTGWAFCNGQAMAISENETLFQLIGTTYGGDGETTFNLPNLQSRVPIHQGTGPDGTTYQMGQQAGTEQETLTVQQTPIHSHAPVASNTVSTQTSPSNLLLAQSSAASLYISDVAATPLAANSVSPRGGSQPHENLQPFLCVNFIIALFGVFPPPS